MLRFVVFVCLACGVLCQPNDGMGVVADSNSVFPEEESTDEIGDTPNIRQFFFKSCEDKINEHLKYEFKASQIYLSMSMYLSRWDISLPGFARKFRAMSDEEREHGIKLMEYINKRGGIAQMPVTIDVGDYTTQIMSNDWNGIEEILKKAIKLERDVNRRLVEYVRTCVDTKNYHMEDFIDSNFLTEQVDSIHELGTIYTQLKRIGFHMENNYGLYQYDKELK